MPPIRRELSLALLEAKVAGRPLYRVAADAHVDPKTLARVASGRQTPFRRTQVAIAAALDRDPAELFCDLEDADAAPAAA